MGRMFRILGGKHKVDDEVLDLAIGKVSRSTIKLNPTMVRAQYNTLLAQCKHENDMFYGDLRDSVMALSRKHYGEYGSISDKWKNETDKSFRVSREILQKLYTLESMKEPYEAYEEYRKIEAEMKGLGL